jgi:poly(A) polymerase
MGHYLSSGLPPAQALHKSATRALNQQIKHTAIPRRFSTVMREMWELQLRLDKRAGKRADAMMEHPRFRAAYDFLLLREQAEEIKPGLGDWWTRYQEQDEQGRRQMISGLGNQPGGGNKRRRRRRKKPSTEG